MKYSIAVVTAALVFLAGSSLLQAFNFGDVGKKIDKLDKKVKETEEKVTGKTVPVMERERWLLNRVFGKTLDAGKLNFRFKSVLSIGSTRTTKNTIQFDKKHNITDSKYRESPKFFILLVHEATHVWQFQNIGLRYIPDSLFHQGKGQVIHGTRNEAYKYTLEKEKPFNKYNSEQQAKMIEEYIGLTVFLKEPRFCKNYASTKKEGFIKTVEAIITRDVNPQFKPVDGNKVRKKLYTTGKK